MSDDDDVLTEDKKSNVVIFEQQWTNGFSLKLSFPTPCRTVHYDFTSSWDQKKQHTCVPVCVADLMQWFRHRSRPTQKQVAGHGTLTAQTAPTTYTTYTYTAYHDLLGLHSNDKQLCSSMIYRLRENVAQKGMICAEALAAMAQLGCWDWQTFRHFRTWFRRTQSDKFPEKDKDNLEYAQAFREALVTALSTKSIGPIECRRVVRIARYFRIATLDGLRTALVTFGPCLLVTPYYNNSQQFWRPSRKQYERYLDKTEESLRADRLRELEQQMDLEPAPRRFHCTLVVGYKDDDAHLTLRNSWGAKWGPLDNGTCTFPYADFAKYVTEVWAIDAVC